jgi:hypothetical protein
VLERGLGAVGALLGLLFLVVNLMLGAGVVREHCLDVTATQATGSVHVDSHWTYIMWAPLYFSAADPSGRCVRNTPFHEALSYLGIWKLPSPTEQVRRHIASQLHSGPTGTNLSPPQSGAAQQARAYIAEVGAALQPLRIPPTSPTGFAGARAILNKVISQLQALAPPAGARAGHRALIAAMERQRDLSFAFERTARAHNSVATRKLEGEIIRAQTAMNAAIGRIRAYATACSSDVNRCGPQLVS